MLRALLAGGVGRVRAVADGSSRAEPISPPRHGARRDRGGAHSRHRHAHRPGGHREAGAGRPERASQPSPGSSLGAYQIKVEAEGFQGFTVPFNVRRGNNNAMATMTVAMREEVFVKETDAALRRDNGFTQTLSKDDIDGLSDDPDEMAEQLRQMAGPGAQIFIDGFRGGRLPPKDQIQSDSLPLQLVLCRVSRGRNGSRRGHHPSPAWAAGEATSTSGSATNR